MENLKNIQTVSLVEFLENVEFSHSYYNGQLNLQTPYGRLVLIQNENGKTEIYLEQCENTFECHCGVFEKQVELHKEV